jgi:putative Holliday junction resolvase
LRAHAKQSLPERKWFLGIDYGRKRIGLAISEAGLIARPLKTIENKGERKNFSTLTEIVNQNKVDIIVVGLPVHENTVMSEEVLAFTKTLEPLGCLIAFQNEMLTSVEAEKILRSGRDCFAFARNDKKSIDAVAASMI